MERTVLIVEDEKLIIVSTQMVLEAAGFRVESAVNGEQGISKAKGLKPALILLDIMTVSYTHLTLPTIYSV